MKLSLCAIVRDEEATLASCLRSVRDVADELVVLDTGSRDRTPDIAREWGARVEQFQWCNDFAAARNESLKYASGDWILVLDADEVLVPAIVPQIRAVMENDRLIAANLVRQEVGAAQSPYTLVSRLFRNHPEIRFSRPYHATIDDRVMALLQREPHWQVGQLDPVAIAHRGYAPKTIAARNKLDRARTAIESYLSDNPTDAYACSKLGALYVQIGQVEGGIELLERGLQNTTDALVRYELYYHLGIARTRLQPGDRALDCYRQALQQDVLPKLKLGSWINLGNLLKEFGRFPEAETAYRSALDIDPNLAIAHYNLGMTLKETKQFPDAIAAYCQAIQIRPDYAEAHQNLGVVLLKLGRVVEGMKSFRRAIAIYERRQSPIARQLRQALDEMGFQV